MTSLAGAACVKFVFGLNAGLGAAFLAIELESLFEFVSGIWVFATGTCKKKGQTCEGQLGKASFECVLPQVVPTSSTCAPV